MTQATTIQALTQLRTTPLKQRILGILSSAGGAGATHAEIRLHFVGEDRADGTINTRYSELARDGLINAAGDTRISPKGRDQLVWRLVA